MTAEWFMALEAQIPATEARRMMDAAQAALYPQLKAEDARRLWMSWERAAYPPVPINAPAGHGARFYWNGKAIDPGSLKQRLAGHLGAGLSA